MVLLVLLDWDIPFRRILRRFWVHCCETRICCSKQNIFVELVTYKIRCRPTFLSHYFHNISWLWRAKGIVTQPVIVFMRTYNQVMEFTETFLKITILMQNGIFLNYSMEFFLWWALRLRVCIDAAIEIRGDMVIHFWSGSIKSKFVE